MAQNVLSKAPTKERTLYQTHLQGACDCGNMDFRDNTHLHLFYINVTCFV